MPERLAELPRDRPIATICASGYRSSVAASLLRAAGFERVGRRPAAGYRTGRRVATPIAYGPDDARRTSEPVASAETHTH